MRVYISGPITGTTDFLERFTEAEKQMRKKGYEVFNPAKLSLALPETAEWEDYMKLSIAMLSCCDTILMLSGWERSRGAIKEYHLAMAADMVILNQHGGMYEKEQTGKSARV